MELDCFSCHSLNGSDHHCEDKNVKFHEEFAKKCTLSAKVEVRYLRRNHIACNTDKETDESWDTYIYNMNNQFWAVGWAGL